MARAARLHQAQRGSPGTVSAACSCSTNSQVRKRHFLSHLYIKVIFLPRQARDKHRENSKKVPFSRRNQRSHAHRSPLARVGGRSVRNNGGCAGPTPGGDACTGGARRRADLRVQPLVFEFKMELYSTSFCVHTSLQKMIILPRQAWDKHGETKRKKCRHGGTMNTDGEPRRCLHVGFGRRGRLQQTSHQQHLDWETFRRLSPAHRVLLQVEEPTAAGQEAKL
jgi:hypothetical protein